MIKLNRTKYKHIKISVCKTGEILIRSMDSINVNILVVKLYYNMQQFTFGGN